MASRARDSPQPSSSVERPVGLPSEGGKECPEVAALGWCDPPPPGSASGTAAAGSRLPEACHPGASQGPAPSPTGLRGPSAGVRRAAGAAPRAQPPCLLDRETRETRDPGQKGGLEAHLKLALSREARLWRRGDLQLEICQAFQDIVLWLLGLDNIFGFSKATFNLALTILSRLLISAKVKERLLEIVTISSLRLAAKVHEEDEVIPHVKDFIKHYGSKYSPNELLRMELAILDKLHWDLYIATPLDFLTIFHALVVLNWPQVMELLPQRNPSLHVESLTRQLQHCMAGHQVLQFKGSTLALVIITLELERLMPDWCTPISDLLKKTQVSVGQFSCCKEHVKHQLRSL